MRTPTPAIQVQLELGWNTYLLFNSDEGEAESIVFFNILFFGGALIVGGWGVVGCSRKSYLGPAETASFSRRDFSWSNKHDTFWHVVSTGYFYILYLWAIANPDFLSLENFKNLGFSLFTIIIITVNSHADNLFLK